jgi:CBS domain-containing protein
MKEVRVGDVMRKGVITLPQDAAVKDAAETLKKNAIGSIIVLHKSEPVGILTERDLVFKVMAPGKDPKKVKLKQVMSSPLKAVGPEVDIEDAAKMMRDERIKRLPVVSNKGKLIGILSETDVVRVSPALFDIIRERNTIERFGKAEEFTGICEECFNYSESLRKVGKKLVCEDCEEESEA